MKALLRTAAQVFAKPKYLITDKGGRPVEGAFRKAVRHLGARLASVSRTRLRCSS